MGNNALSRSIPGIRRCIAYQCCGVGSTKHDCQCHAVASISGMAVGLLLIKNF